MYGIVSTKDIKRMIRTLKIAKMSTLRYQMGASIYLGNRHISSAFNVLKTHPDHMRYYQQHCISIHSEHNALLNAQTSVNGATLYVIRFKGETSKPCNGCMELIRHAGIETIVYTFDGAFIKEFV
jgi:deoxycytidylate deaminase